MVISSLLNLIENQEIILPAIQRNFVWTEDKIQKLMDSVMRGYPVGIILMWETYNGIQYRKFEKHYASKNLIAYFENEGKTRKRLVLDGQQRLQSLYIALYGSYDGRYLYFDVLSGEKLEDFEEDKYIFHFGTTEDGKQWNKDQEAFAKAIKNGEMALAENERLGYYVKVCDLFKMSGSEKQTLRKELCKKLNLSEADELKLETNLAKIDEVFTKDQNIVKESIIDESKAIDATDRQTESDVLEIFVRINRQGTPLSRSDLIFSMLKLNWKESATSLPDFVDNINEGNTFEINIDFVIRCLYAVSELGTKFNIDLLRKQPNIERMKANFDNCCKAIKSTIDTVSTLINISSSKVLGGNQNIVPFVYYMFHMPKHTLPESATVDFKKSLFMLCFTNPFSRYGDSRLSKFIKTDMEKIKDKKSTDFPYKAAIRRVGGWEGITEWGDQVFRKNPLLVHNLIQNLSGAKTHYNLNSPEMDHIFPKSTLIEKGYDEVSAGHYANFWILPKGKNINKTNKHPKDYFTDVSSAILKKAEIDPEYFDYRKYNTFLKSRSQSIRNRISEISGIDEADFEQN